MSPESSIPWRTYDQMTPEQKLSYGGIEKHLTDPDIQQAAQVLASKLHVNAPSITRPLGIGGDKGLYPGHIEIGPYTLSFGNNDTFNEPEAEMFCVIAISRKGENFQRNTQVRTKEKLLEWLTILQEPDAWKKLRPDHWEYDIEDIGIHGI